jgi:hypothetical protein
MANKAKLGPLCIACIAAGRAKPELSPAIIRDSVLVVDFLLDDGAQALIDAEPKDHAVAAMPR